MVNTLLLVVMVVGYVLLGFGGLGVGAMDPDGHGGGVAMRVGGAGLMLLVGGLMAQGFDGTVGISASLVLVVSGGLLAAACVPTMPGLVESIRSEFGWR